MIVKLKKNLSLLFALYENLVYLQRIKRSYNEHSIALQFSMLHYNKTGDSNSYINDHLTIIFPYTNITLSFPYLKIQDPIQLQHSKDTDLCRCYVHTMFMLCYCDRATIAQPRNNHIATLTSLHPYSINTHKNN